MSRSNNTSPAATGRTPHHGVENSHEGGISQQRHIYWTGHRPLPSNPSLPIHGTHSVRNDNTFSNTAASRPLCVRLPLRCSCSFSLCCCSIFVSLLFCFRFVFVLSSRCICSVLSSLVLPSLDQPCPMGCITISGRDLHPSHSCIFILPRARSQVIFSIRCSSLLITWFESTVIEL